MDKLLLTKCLRCRGAMIYDKFYGPHEQFWGWRCIYCQGILEQTIIENRNGPKRLTRIHEQLLNL